MLGNGGLETECQILRPGNKLVLRQSSIELARRTFFGEQSDYRTPQVVVSDSFFQLHTLGTECFLRCCAQNFGCSKQYLTANVVACVAI